MHNALHPDDVETFGFDAAAIDWQHYIAGVHTPAVTSTLRALSGGPSRGEPVRVDLGAARTDAGQVVAVFDMDGTLLPSNVVESYLWLRLPELAGTRRAREVADVARALPRWLLTERRDRGAFLRAVYRRYAGADYDELLRIVDEHVTGTVLGRLSPGAARAVREHRAAGHRDGRANAVLGGRRMEPAVVRRDRVGGAECRPGRSLHRLPRASAARR